MSMSQAPGKKALLNLNKEYGQVYIYLEGVAEGSNKTVLEFPLK